MVGAQANACHWLSDHMTQSVAATIHLGVWWFNVGVLIFFLSKMCVSDDLIR